jgi:hypothetical protein
MVFISLLLAAVNQTFSLLDPLFFGKLFDEYIIKAESFRNAGKSAEFFKGVMGYLGILIGVAMVSRIAKAFQDYFSSVVIQKFGAQHFYRRPATQHAPALSGV